jgi:hypothetical protein
MASYRIHTGEASRKPFEAATDAEALDLARKQWPKARPEWLQKLARNGGWNWIVPLSKVN